MEILGEFEILIISSIILLGVFTFFNIVCIGIFAFKKFKERKVSSVEAKSEIPLIKKISTNFLKDINEPSTVSAPEEPKEESEKVIKKRFNISLEKLKTYIQFSITKYLLINISLVIVFLFLQYLTFNPSEAIVSTYPVQNGFWSDYEKPVEVRFNRPIRPEQIELYMSDNIDGEWRFEKSFSFLPFSRVARFYPNESFFPDEIVKIYIVNFNRFDIGEYPLDFYTAALPEVVNVSPSDQEADVMTDRQIVIGLDKQIGNYVDIDIKINPPIEFDKEIRNNDIIIKPKEALKQTTPYTVSVYNTAQTYNLNTREIINKKDKIKVHESIFKTIKAPLIESYSPEGTGVRADAIVTVVFDEPMNQSEIENAFAIEPNVEGNIEWTDERTFVFKPTALTKETKYTVTFDAGISSKSGGETESEVKFEFETVGSVKVLSFAPGNGFSGADIKTAVSVTFDQEVDKASAQSSFSIVPAVQGTFSWSGNTMVFRPTTGLNYSTNYTVSVAQGVKTLYGFDSKQAFSSMFATRSAVFLLNIGHIYQQNAFGCNSTAAAMVMNYKGVATSESQVYYGAGSGPQPNRSGGGNPHLGWVPDYGVYWEPIAQYVNSRGLSAQYYTNWNLTSALKEVEAGNPVIIWWQNGVSAPSNISYTASNGQAIHAVNGMHSVVIIGYQGTPESPTLIYYHDSYFGASRSRSPESFDFLWSTWRMGSVPANYRRVGMVVK